MKNETQSIALLPPSGGEISIVDNVSRLIRNSDTFRAAIAFWTLSPNSLSNMIGFDPIPTLKQSGSYLCCDLQWPTNIDNLAKFVENGVDVYLNLRRLSDQNTKFSDTSALLHSKVILSDRSDKNADLWVGSHNWTDFALRGPNTEMSLAIILSKKASLYQEMENFINEVKEGICLPFDLNKINYYKDLQQRLFERAKRTSSVIELEGDNIYNLNNEVVNIFGVNPDDLKLLGQPGGSVYISLYDTKKSHDPNAKALYKAEILQSGVLDTLNPAATGLAINARRRYAFNNRLRFPVLEAQQTIPPMILNEALFFITIEIKKTLHDNFIAVEPSNNKTPLWAAPIEDLSLESAPAAQGATKPISNKNSRIPF